VSIYKNGNITCSCPDYINTCKKLECVCKHCIAVIWNVIGKDDVHNEFYTRLKLNKKELQKLKINEK
jgi:predicted nucleic acid-binding Zn finger protein